MRAVLLSIFLAVLVALISISLAMPQQILAAAPNTTNFSENHQLYDTGTDIAALQQFLNTHGFLVALSGPGAPGEETGFFGILTYQALIKFQAAHGLPATGFFGPLTRALLNGSDTTQTAPTTSTLTQTQISAILSLLQSFGADQATVNNVQAALGTPGTTHATTTAAAPPIYTTPPPTPAIGQPWHAPSGGGGGGGPLPPTCTLSASPTNISIGNSTSLTWTSTNATTASIDQSIGSVSLNGSESVSPTTNTTYILTVANSSGSTASCSTNTSATDTTSPTVSLTAPSSGATVGGTSVTLTATASDNVAVANVQFKVDGTNIGSAVTFSPYTTTWNSIGVSDGSHTLYAVAADTSGNYATSSISVTVRNSPPVISAIASSTAQTTATITWTTDEAANSKVVYGATSAYGSATSSAALLTSHSIGVIGLTASTLYHYAVVSTDGQGNTATSSDQTFTTAFDYYVDSVNGNDSNSGLSPVLAFQTLAKLKSVVDGSTGKSVALAKGSIWTEEFNITASHLTIDSYGTGNAPFLDGGATVSNGNFSLTAGKTLTYQAALNFATGAVAEFRPAFENNQ